VLAKPPEQIKLSDLFHSLEGTVTTAECTDNQDYCGRSADCAAREVWVKVETAINEVLSKITLADLVKSAKKRASDYQI